MSEWLRHLSPVFLISLFLTELLELIIAAIWGVRGKKDLFLVLLGNILTNPFVVLFHYLAVRQGHSTNSLTLILEAVAVVVEGFIYDKVGYDISYPYFFSICANVFSYAIGMLLSVIL